MREQAMQSKLIVRVLDDHAITCIQEHALNDGKCLLCTSDHQYVRGIASDPAAPPEIVRNGAAQWQVPAG
jgi:hypothetical protein